MKCKYWCKIYVINSLTTRSGKLMVYVRYSESKSSYTINNNKVFVIQVLDRDHNVIYPRCVVISSGKINGYNSLV